MTDFLLWKPENFIWQSLWHRWSSFCPLRAKKKIQIFPSLSAMNYSLQFPLNHQPLKLKSPSYEWVSISRFLEMDASSLQRSELGAISQKDLLPGVVYPYYEFGSSANQIPPTVYFFFPTNCYAMPAGKYEATVQSCRPEQKLVVGYSQL